MRKILQQCCYCKNIDEEKSVSNDKLIGSCGASHNEKGQPKSSACGAANEPATKIKSTLDLLSDAAALMMKLKKRWLVDREDEKMFVCSSFNHLCVYQTHTHTFTNNNIEFFTG